MCRKLIVFIPTLAPMNVCAWHSHLPSAIPLKPCGNTIRGHEDLALLDWGLCRSKRLRISKLAVVVLTEAFFACGERPHLDNCVLAPRIRMNASNQASPCDNLTEECLKLKCFIHAREVLHPSNILRSPTQQPIVPSLHPTPPWFLQISGLNWPSTPPLFRPLPRHTCRICRCVTRDAD
ncbi:hypothetical protein BD769DRAFT_1049012 [Suillus cothurnatus]|nr:hypothetical protein BD769DRAFT_1049012 [Suillus cothurnatus]